MLRCSCYLIRANSLRIAGTSPFPLSTLNNNNNSRDMVALLSGSRRGFAKLLPRRLRSGKLQFSQEMSEFLQPFDYRIAIIGRPNVGKSTLVNRLAGRQVTIVHKSPGMTRDRKEVKGYLAGLNFTLIDTPGLEDPNDKGTQEEKESLPDTQLLNGEPMSLELQKSVQRQTDFAVRNCDIIVFMYDIRTGISSVDESFAKWVRARIVNKEGMSPLWFREHTSPPEGWIEEKKNSIPLSSSLTEEEELFPEDEFEPVTVPTQVICVANKCERESATSENEIFEGFALGFGEVIELSAEANEGMSSLHASLLRAMLALFPVKYKQLIEKEAEEKRRRKNFGDRQEIRLVIAGKPNVGKSTLVNHILGESRVVTGDQPGVTRDAIQIDFVDPSLPSHAFHLVDTAGLRGVRESNIEKFTQPDALAMKSSLESIKYAHVVALVIDCSKGISEAISLPKSFSNKRSNKNEQLTKDELNLLESKVSQVLSQHDMAVARMAEAEGRALLLVANKIDNIAEKEREKIIDGLKQLLTHMFPQNKGTLVLPVSAKEGNGMAGFLPAVVDVYNRWSGRISTGLLNRWLKQLTDYKPHPKIKGESVKFKYISQVNSRPPSFKISSNRAALDISPAYLRFFTNSLRDEFKLAGIPIRMNVVKSKNPYAEKPDSQATVEHKKVVLERRQAREKKRASSSPDKSSTR